MKHIGTRASIFSLPVAALLAVSCSSNQAQKGAVAKADIQGFLPNTVGGTVYFTEMGTKGTRVHGEILGLLPNREYAIHVHEGRSCANPDATGPHFDPIGSGQHGVPGASPGARHAGDLPNISTDGDGKARIDVTSHLLGVGSSQFSVLGRSMVLHAGRDDYQTQPAGASGQKIACGVIEAAEG